MFIKEPITCHDSAKPIIYLNFFMGIGAYRQPNISDIAYFCMKIYTIIFILSNWTITYIGAIELMAGECYKFDTNAAYTLYRVLNLMNSGVAVIAPFWIWIQYQGLKDYFRQLPILDETLHDILGVQNCYRKQYIRLTRHVIGIVLPLSLITCIDTSLILSAGKSLCNRTAIAYIMHYPVIVTLVLDLNFFTLIGYLQMKFQDLNDGLLKMAKKSSSPHGSKEVSVIPRKVLKTRPGLKMGDVNAEGLQRDNHYLLYQIRKTYSELCKLSRKINLVFGIQNLLSMGISFGMVTVLLYMTYSAIPWQNFAYSDLMYLVPIILWTIVYIVKIWIINHSCWSLSSEADRTGDVIYELLETRVDKEFQSEIQDFAVQIIQNPVRFSACGFFTLDYTFVQGVIGSITTYLVIFIQMSQVSKFPVFIPAAAWNSTEISSDY